MAQPWGVGVGRYLGRYGHRNGGPTLDRVSLKLLFVWDYIAYIYMFGYKCKYSNIVFSMLIFGLCFAVPLFVPTSEALSHTTCPGIRAHNRTCLWSVSTTTMVPKLGWMKQVIKPFTFYCWGLVPTPFTESLWSVWWGGFSLAQQISLDYSSGGFCKKERKKFAAGGKVGAFFFFFFLLVLLLKTAVLDFGEQKL